MAQPIVSVSAVPFNPQTQTFGSTPNMNMGTVNLNSPAPVQQPAQVNAIKPATIPQSQNIGTFSTQKINLPTQTLTQTPQVANYPASYIQQQPTAQQQQDQAVVDYNTNLYKTIANIIPQMSGQSQELQSQKLALGIPEMNKQFTDLNNQILQKNAELNQSDVSLAQGLQNIQDQAIPMQFITGQQASVQNQAQLARAVKVSNINMLNALAQSTQGNIALAQQTAQDAVDLKYAPIKDMYNTLIAQQQAIQPLLSSAEKRISAEQTATYELQKQMATQRQNNETKFMDMLMKAPTDLGATPAQINKAISIYNQTGDPIQAFSGLSGADQYIQSFQTENAIRNYNNSGIGQLTIDNGYTFDDFKKGIAYVESSGGNNYGVEGPMVTSGIYKGQKALGKYQVMPGNLPSWLKEAGLPNMTPKQFLASPTAQEKVFETRSLTEYTKYGNWDDVASVWFSGAPAKNNTRGDGYNSTPQYLTKMRTGMGITSQNSGVQNDGVVVSPTIITYAKSVQENPDNMKYVPKALIPQVMAYNQANPAQTNQSVTKEEQARFIIDSITKAEGLSGAAGRSAARKFVENWGYGATDYTNLESQIRTIKTNLLTLATDPNIKKFFGPQMTEADVRNMQAAASTLDAELQDPQAMQNELARAKTIFQKFVPGYNPTLPTVKADTIMQIHNSMSTPRTGYQIFAQ